ncbi:MAG TPA: hypothetical protein H9915_11105 [Candidatus Gemmiger faecigallinarum]|nr:hypothetical protein [Candidatus Gemmiger faecigallinarum]
MGLLFSVIYLGLFLAAGILTARRVFPAEGPALCLPLGCAAGVSLLAAFPALFALFFDFTLPAVLAAGGAAALLVLALCLLPHRRRKVPAGRSPGRRADAPAMAACVLPLLALTCVLLYTHILRPQDGALHTGQSCYGDLAMHLAYIKGIAVTGIFPPIEPLLAGRQPLNYPYLCETVSSVFLLLGADLRAAYLLPELPAFAAVYGMGWQLARRMLGSAGKASLAFWLFFMGSGFGFAYFLGSPESFASIFTGYYTTPTNYTAQNILWVNPIVDLLIPQRATLFGWCVLFAALYLLWRFAMEGQRRLWLPLALLVLPLPLMQTHSALALVVLCLVCGVYTLCCRPRTARVLLPWLGLAVLCGAVWLPESLGSVLSQAVGGENMLRLHFNWANNPDGTLTDPYFWFYIKNIGVVYLLLIPAFLHAGKRQRWFYGGGLALLLLSEFVVFQPNLYDNNKLLFFWHLLGCVLVAGFSWDLLAKLRRPALRILAGAAVCLLATAGSILTVGRELVSDYVQWTADDVALAAFAEAETAPDALFLTSRSHLLPVASLAGRQVVCGSDIYLYYHGVDYTSERNAVQQLYETPDQASLDAWGVDYVVFDANVAAQYDADEAWYAANASLCYQNGSCRVYQVG